jgi:hypothetical protein
MLYKNYRVFHRWDTLFPIALHVTEKPDRTPAWAAHHSTCTQLK